MATALQAPISKFVATIIRRIEPVHDRYYDAPQPEIEDSLDQRYGAFEPREFTPPTTSAFYGQGRDSEHAPTPHRFYQTVDINARLAIAGWPFAIPKVPGAFVVGMPRGEWNARAPRVNIQSGTPMAYGNMANLTSPIVSGYEYAKLTL